MKTRLTYRHTILLLMAAVLLTACSTTKNTGWTRFYQSLTTRYNVHFNAEQNYIEQLKLQQEKYEDNFTDLLYMSPAQAYNNPKDPQPQGSFDRTIEKCETAIQKHSIKSKPKRKQGKRNDPKYKAFMQREEYNSFIHNSWMLMGKAQYNKGDFLGAASTFMYVAQHFTWLPEIVAEARLWQARSYIALDWIYEAEDVLYKANNDSLPPSLNGEFASVNADYLINNKEYKKAIPYLQIAIKHEHNKAQRARLTFLLGQLYALDNKPQEAYNAYKKVISMNPSYRTQFNARIKMSEVFMGDDIEKEVKALRRMTRKGANKDYLDQIYYAIGNIYLSRQDTLEAIQNYRSAISRSTRNGIEKAVCQITLGELHFGRREYVDAQPCYSEALPLLKEDYPNYKTLSRRSTVLDKLVVYAQNVELQDSLQVLAAMSEEERNTVIQKIIDDLIKKEKEEAENQAREEYLAQNEGLGQDMMQGGANRPTTNVMNSDGSWYFYNQTLVNSGKSEFQKKWGSRKLEDDWRRRNKSGFSTSDFGMDSNLAENEATSEEMTPDGEIETITPEDSVALANSEDPHKIEYYLKQIPLTPEEITVSNEIIADGLYNMGLILKNDLEDYEAASATFDELEERFPDNPYLADTYYNRYLMHMRNEEPTQAEVYRQKILTSHSESDYATALSDADFLEKRRTAAVKQDSIYRETYAAYLDNNNHLVHSNVEYVKSEYPLAEIMHKFIFLNAMAYIGDKEYDKFKENVEELLSKYPQADVSDYAGNILKGMSQGRTIEGSGNARGMIWTTRLGNDSTAVSDSTATFTHEPASEHYFLLAFDNRDVSGNHLLYEVARMNFSHFLVKDFELEINTFNELSILIVKGFNNFDELIHYRSVMNNESDFVLPDGVRPVMISTANYNLLMQGHSLEEYFEFFNNYYILNNDEATDDTMGGR